MKKFYSVLFVSAVAATAWADDSFFVTPAPLPDIVKEVFPEQGLLDVSGSANPLGVKQITVVFGNDVEVDANSGGSFLLYKEGEANPIATLPADQSHVDSMDSKRVGFQFPGTYLDDGVYYVEIPAGVWTVGGVSVPAFHLNYEIFRTMVVSPQGGVQKELSSFQIEFPGASSVEAVAGKKAAFSKDSSVDSWSVSSSVAGASATLTIVGGPVTGEGTYGLEIPAGMFKVTYAGHPGVAGDTRTATVNSEALLLKYSMSPMPAPAVTPAPGVVSGFDKFVFTYPAGFELWFVDDMSMSEIYPVSAEGIRSHAPLCKLRPVQTESGFELQVLDDARMPVTSPLVPAPGSYVLQLSNGLLFGAYNGNTGGSIPYEYMYKIEGQSTVVPAVVSADRHECCDGVYNLYGVKVGESLESLPAGIYIFNSRKVIVK